MGYRNSYPGDLCRDLFVFVRPSGQPMADATNVTQGHRFEVAHLV